MLRHPVAGLESKIDEKEEGANMDVALDALLLATDTVSKIQFKKSHFEKKSILSIP